MDRKKTSITSVTLGVNAEALAKFTTLLQGGFLLDVPQKTSIGELLVSLPGFSKDYIAQRVQTIFLGGLPADDLDQQLLGIDAVLAISAAMPGLAGAIFRKNGVHASLRTSAGKVPLKSPETNGPVKIRLKLFNMIAVEKGEGILNSGCIIPASSLQKFLTYRNTLSSQIREREINGKDCSLQELLSLLEQEDTIKLTVRGNHDS
ncbi:MAG: hypothetical protein KKD01_19380 [Proteobacteria bacterium]|nr:hypothetical protein [Pseudomonadota bacterium]MBU1233947.1 hypothetical protein [Pseudomonadota bacterium]MBU1420768.1 hypothetical protein [Pseudomonadota bacterium]MBU1456884.1 hypothetical protein [Pseudomonadota bacterium]